MVRNYLDCWCKVKLPILQQNVAEKLWVRGRPKNVGICKSHRKCIHDVGMCQLGAPQNC